MNGQQLVQYDAMDKVYSQRLAANILNQPQSDARQTAVPYRER